MIEECVLVVVAHMAHGPFCSHTIGISLSIIVALYAQDVTLSCNLEQDCREQPRCISCDYPTRAAHVLLFLAHLPPHILVNPSTLRPPV